MSNGNEPIFGLVFVWLHWVLVNRVQVLFDFHDDQCWTIITCKYAPSLPIQKIIARSHMIRVAVFFPLFCLAISLLFFMLNHWFYQCAPIRRKKKSLNQAIELTRSSLSLSVLESKSVLIHNIGVSLALEQSSSIRIPSFSRNVRKYTCRVLRRRGVVGTSSRRRKNKTEP